MPPVPPEQPVPPANAPLPDSPPGTARDDPDLLLRLADVTEQVAAAALAAGRAPADVRVLLATKTIDPDRILRVLAAGHRLIGENRAQEVVAKADALAPSDHECHFIGHLQANKVNQVLPHVSCVQTVDSPELGRRLHGRAELLERTLDVMVQVNVSGEESKSGVTLAQVPELLAALAGFDRLRVCGYMTIGLNSPDLAAVRAGYRSLAEFRDCARSKGLSGAERATQLSMGMSGDFAAAIAEGATMVRLGSAVFGPRASNGPPQL